MKISRRVGIIGTGLLGTAVAKRLLDSGYPLVIYNRTKEKAEMLRPIGAKIANSPKQVAQLSDIVITIVKDADAIESVSFGSEGIVHGKHERLVVADMSTISPISTRRIAKRFHHYGILKLDTPVMGGPGLAEKGELVLMIGGDREGYERYTEVFNTIGNKVFFLGEHGSGHLMKLAMNLQITMLALSLSEGITLVRRGGIDPLRFLEVLNSTYFKTGMSVNKAPKMAQGQFPASFRLETLTKDLDEIMYTAKEFGLTLPMIALACEHYHDALKNGFGELDYTGILAHIDKINERKQ